MVCRRDLIDDDFGPGQQLGSGTGHRDPAGGAGEQRRAQLAVQPPDQLTECRSGHVQALGGPAGMKLGGHRHERFQLAQFHSPTVPRVTGTIVARCAAGTGLFGRAEECRASYPFFRGQNRVILTTEAGVQPAWEG